LVLTGDGRAGAVSDPPSRDYMRPGRGRFISCPRHVRPWPRRDRPGPGGYDAGGMAKTRAGRLPILLVEDDADHAELVRMSVARLPREAELTVVSDGEEALAYLMRRGPWADPSRSPRPHLILLDLRLPKLDGFQVLEQIKAAEALRAIPVVVLTTSRAESDVVRAYANHVNSYLVKPVEFDRFVDLVKDVDEYWLDWNRQPPAESA
jgi:CheY-like chemotaxis protein